MEPIIKLKSNGIIKDIKGNSLQIKNCFFEKKYIKYDYNIYNFLSYLNEDDKNHNNVIKILINNDYKHIFYCEELRSNNGGKNIWYLFYELNNIFNCIGYMTQAQGGNRINFYRVLQNIIRIDNNPKLFQFKKFKKINDEDKLNEIRELKDYGEMGEDCRRRLDNIDCYNTEKLKEYLIKNNFTKINIFRINEEMEDFKNINLKEINLDNYILLNSYYTTIKYGPKNSFFLVLKEKDNKKEKIENITDINNNEVDNLLNDWVIEMYTNNPHLVDIPENRIREKRNEILNMYKNVN